MNPIKLGWSILVGIYSYVEFLYQGYLKGSSGPCRSTSFEGSEEQGRVKKLKLQKVKDRPSGDTRIPSYAEASSSGPPRCM